MRLSQSEPSRAGLSSRRGRSRGSEQCGKRAFSLTCKSTCSGALLPQGRRGLEGARGTLARLVMAYPGYGGGVSPGRFAAASAPSGCGALARLCQRASLPSVPASFAGLWYPAAPALHSVLVHGPGRAGPSGEPQVFRSLRAPSARPWPAKDVVCF